MTRCDRGATLIELLVAVALLGLAMSVVAALTLPVLAVFEAEPAAADAQQRARSIIHAIVDDVQRAGSGFLQTPEDGPGLALPALVPDVTSTGVWPVQPQAGVLSTVHAPRGAAHGAVRQAIGAGDAVVPLERPAFCPAATPTCGFAPGDEIAVFLPHGRLALATVRQVVAPLDLVLTAPLLESWPVGASVSAITARTYELRGDAATGLSQIVRRLGGGPATPVVDFVRRFDVEWVVVAGAPSVPLAPDGTELYATAAPAPPAPGMTAHPAWPAGENCAFFRDAVGTAHWRGATGGPMPAPVSLAMFADGPWCPGPAAPLRWDADLVRVAEVRIVVGVAVAAATLRPPVGLGLARRPGARLVPDLIVETTVRPGRRGGGA